MALDMKYWPFTWSAVFLSGTDLERASDSCRSWQFTTFTGMQRWQDACEMPQALPHALFCVLPFSSSCNKKEWVHRSDCTSSCLYVVLLGLSPTLLSFRAVLWCTTFEICPEAAGVSSKSKQIYFPRRKIHNFPSATSPVLLKTGWESGCRSLSSGDWV